MKKTVFLNLSEVLFISLLVLSFIFQGIAPAFAQTTTVSNSSGNKLKFVKTLLNIPTVHNGGGQIITSAILASNNFVFGGDCGVEMTGSRAGGGIWIVSENGLTIKERQACLDAGSGTNMIYQHANVHQDELHADASGGFVRENSSWASCIIPGTAGTGDCKQFGDGANRAVYYGASGNPVSTSPLYTYNTQLVALKNRVIALGSGIDGGATLLSLPSWQVVTTLENITGPSIGFGDFLVNRGILYSISSGGIMEEVKKLTTDGGSNSAPNSSVLYSFDNSAKLAKLAVADVSRSDSSNPTKIYVYKIFGRGVALDKIIEIPNGALKLTGNSVNSFGIWGQYIITAGPQSGEIDVWKNGQKIETVKMPVGGYTFDIVVSKAGYVAITTLRNDEAKTAAYLYKIFDSVNIFTPPVVDPMDESCNGASGSLADLCKQYKEILRKTCLVAPEIAICQSQ